VALLLGQELERKMAENKKPIWVQRIGQGSGLKRSELE
jgi:hypothetical protein